MLTRSIAISIVLLCGLQNARSEQPCGASVDQWVCHGDAFAASCRNCDTPVWTVRADALALARTRPSDRVLYANPLQPQQQLDAADFHLGYEAGIDLSLKRLLACGYALELRYLKNDAWNGTALTATDTNDPLSINAAIPVFLPTGRTIDAQYASQLDNLELNFVVPCKTVDWLAGFRYIELDEQLRAELADAVTPSPTVTHSIGTQNRLYGAQLGADVLILQRGGLQVNTIFKGALFHNSSQHASILDTGVIQVDAAGTADRAALLVECSLTARYELTECLSLRGGYTILALDEVTLASDQLSSTNFLNGTGVDGTGNVFYHGGLLGLELAF
jgi:hypothetical protein